MAFDSRRLRVLSGPSIRHVGRRRQQQHHRPQREKGGTDAAETKHRSADENASSCREWQEQENSSGGDRSSVRRTRGGWRPPSRPDGREELLKQLCGWCAYTWRCEKCIFDVHNGRPIALFGCSGRARRQLAAGFPVQVTGVEGCDLGWSRKGQGGNTAAREGLLLGTANGGRTGGDVGGCGRAARSTGESVGAKPLWRGLRPRCTGDWWTRGERGASGWLLGQKENMLSMM